LRAQLGRQGRRRALERFSVPAMVAGIEAEYERALGSSIR
jgi:hypothetical protein